MCTMSNKISTAKIVQHLMFKTVVSSKKQFHIIRHIKPHPYIDKIITKTNKSADKRLN